MIPSNVADRQAPNPVSRHRSAWLSGPGLQTFDGVPDRGGALCVFSGLGEKT